MRAKNGFKILWSLNVTSSTTCSTSTKSWRAKATTRAATDRAPAVHAHCPYVLQVPALKVGTHHMLARQAQIITHSPNDLVLAICEQGVNLHG
eukprot:CAMPEP_0180483736 /NCGR_PEP_ID=MMETSP1036_2-20121128/35579_1 /TAXON_ID=632150 /ORGANISM="Azadinium spinosum, Strain 3D9" /LENGTH=92 /DNA_ID=CAMNT_0022491559 /DNA_START=308 /DNA_END=583 /DNA_ORIENTATION=-